MYLAIDFLVGNILKWFFRETNVDIHAIFSGHFTKLKSLDKVIYKRVALKNFVKFTGSTSNGVLFLVKIQAWLCNFTIKGVHCSFSLWTFTKFLKNCYLIGHLWTGASGHKKIFKRFFPTNIDLFKVNDRNSWKRCEICSKFSIKTLERCQWRRSGGFNC